MIVPKKKTSKARRNSRKANWKITAPAIVECPHCHEFKAPHVICKKCGYYDGAQVKNMDKKKKEAAAAPAKAEPKAKKASASAKESAKTK